MKKFSLLALSAVLTLGITFTSCDSKNSFSSAKLNSDIDTISYLIGADYGKGLKQQISQFPEPGNIDALISGFANAAKGDEVHLGMDEQEKNTFLNTYFQGMQTRMIEEEQAKGEKFLAENKAKSGVITTESGLQYKVITEGKGPKPSIEDQVKVHYVGTLLDGTQFDSSVERGEPITFPLANVIPGWREGVLLMPVGSKYILWVPGEIAYGLQPPPQQTIIKPMSTLMFEVELLEIVK